MKNRIYTERADLYDPNMCISMFFDIIGEVNVDTLMLSTNRAFAAFEATMSRIVLLEDGDAYYELMPVSGCSATITNQDWHTIILENEKSPFSIENGELMRVFVNHSSEKTTVVIMAHHLVGDGKSIVYFIERLMNEYIGKTSNFQPLQLITEKTFPKESRLPFWIKLWVNRFNRHWISNGKVFNFNDYYNLHHAYWNDRESVILINNILPEHVNAIHKKAFDAGTSINSYIISAFLKADKNLSSVGLAVSARFNENRTMSNQATGITVDYKYNDKITFGQNAKQVHKRIYKKLNTPVSKYFILQFIPLFNPSLIDSIMMHTYGLYENEVTEKLSKIMGYSSDSSTSFGITNLTKLDIANTYNDYRIENLYFIPPVVSYSRQTIGIATIESGMTVTYHCMNDKYEERNKTVFEDAMKILLTT